MSDVHGSVQRKSIFKCNQQDATSPIYFCEMLYMFQVVTPPIIGCSKTVRTASGTLSNLYCYLPLSWKLRSISSTPVAGNSKVLTKYPMLYIQFWALDDGRRNRLKHVEHFTEINKLCNAGSCWMHLKIRWRCTDPRTSNKYLYTTCSWLSTWRLHADLINPPTPIH